LTRAASPRRPDEAIITVAASEAYEELLRIRDDSEALDHLCREAREIDEPVKLENLLERLAGRTDDAVVKRDLWLERARLLADRLERPTEAIALLRKLLVELDRTNVAAIDELLITAETQDDFAALAFGLELRLALAKAPRSQAELAQRLSDVCEDALKDPPRATWREQSRGATRARHTRPPQWLGTGTKARVFAPYLALADSLTSWSAPATSSPPSVPVASQSTLGSSVVLAVSRMRA
jgi:hypothetical protein